MRSIEISHAPGSGVIAMVEYFDTASAGPTPPNTYHLHERTLEKAVNSFLPHARVEITDISVTRES